MFRDETVKVEKRVRASWGLNESSSVASTSSASSSASQVVSGRDTTSPTPPTPSRASEQASMPTPPESVASTSPKSTKSAQTRQSSYSPKTPAYESALQRAQFPSPHQNVTIDPAHMGVSFYVQHYLLGYPDEVRRPDELSGVLWFEQPSSQATMAAMGLAALGNLRQDKQLQHLSRIKYGEALARTNEILRDPVKNLETAIRTTVMLALFQVISVLASPSTRSWLVTWPSSSC